MSDSTTSTNQSIADRVISAIKDVYYSALNQGKEPDGEFLKRYGKYVTEIKSARSKDGKAKAIAKHFIPNEEEYNRKRTNYPSYYKDELLNSLLKLLDEFREIALPKEKHIPTKEELNAFMIEVFGSNSTTTNDKSIAGQVLSALRDVLYSAHAQGEELDGKFIVRYRKYVTEINSARSKNGKAKAIAKHIVPNEEEYNKKVTNYREWYKDDLLASLLKLLELYHEIVLTPPKEKRIRSKDEIDNVIAQVFG
jgi:hypothetical protein